MTMEMICHIAKKILEDVRHNKGYKDCKALLKLNYYKLQVIA